MGGVCADYSQSPKLGEGASTILPDGINELRPIPLPPSSRVSLGSGLFRLMGGTYDGVLTYADGRVVDISPTPDAVQKAPGEGASATFSMTVLSADGKSIVTVNKVSEFQIKKVLELQGATIEKGFVIRDQVGFCRMNAGAYAGLVTYDDGRVVRIVPNVEHPKHGLIVYASPTDDSTTKTLSDLSDAQIQLIRSMQQTEVGLCYMSGGSYEITPLPMSAGPWSATHERGLLSLFSNQPNNIYFCADGSQQGEIGMNTSHPHLAIVQDAMRIFRNRTFWKYSNVLGEDSSAYGDIIENIAKQYAPSWYERHEHEVLGSAIGFVSLLGGFFILGPRIQRRWGGGDHGVVGVIERKEAKPKTEADVSSGEPFIMIGNEWKELLKNLDIDKNEWDHAIVSNTWGSLISEKLRDPDCTTHQNLATALHPMEAWLDENRPYESEEAREKFRKDVITAYLAAVSDFRADVGVNKIVNDILGKYLRADKIGDKERAEARKIIDRVEKAAAKEREAREEKKKGI